jgi:hypothetical protein
VVLVCLLLLHPFPMVSWNCYVALEQSLEALGIARCTDCLPCSMSFKVVTHDCLACSNALQGCHHDCLLVQRCPPRLSSMTDSLFNDVLQGCCPWLSSCSTMSCQVVARDCLLVSFPWKLWSLLSHCSTLSFKVDAHDCLLVQCPSRLWPLRFCFLFHPTSWINLSSASLCFPFLVKFLNCCWPVSFSRF